MRRVLVTGANKGIGLAIVEAILTRADDTFVYLGARDEGRGRAAADGLVRAHPEWKDRIEVVPLDVASDRSVEDAAARLGGVTLYGVVNNAGVGRASKLPEILETNVFGVHRVSEAFLPLLEPEGGRVVNVTSAAGPMYVGKCSPEQQKLFTSDTLSWPELRAFVEEQRGAGAVDGDDYGLSKACANVYTAIFARANPKLRVNACTPGYIATDMTGGSAASGAKPPSEGAKAPVKLLFDDLSGNGRYYGSDGKRSPLDRYRAPGDPEFTG